jgi:hypothetical protein
MFDLDNVEISAPQCPTHYSPAVNGNVLDIVIHKNTRLSNVIVSDILDSDHPLIVLHILNHIRTTKFSEPTGKFTNLEMFKNLASDLISSRIGTNLEVEANKAARIFTAPVTSAYSLSTGRVTVSDLNGTYLG